MAIVFLEDLGGRLVEEEAVVEVIGEGEDMRKGPLGGVGTCHTDVRLHLHEGADSNDDEDEDEDEDEDGQTWSAGF
jgi:hypothetical protein